MLRCQEFEYPRQQYVGRCVEYALFLNLCRNRLLYILSKIASRFEGSRFNCTGGRSNRRPTGGRNFAGVSRHCRLSKAKSPVVHADCILIYQISIPFNHLNTLSSLRETNWMKKSWMMEGRNITILTQLKMAVAVCWSFITPVPIRRTYADLAIGRVRKKSIFTLRCTD